MDTSSLFRAGVRALVASTFSSDCNEQFLQRTVTKWKTGTEVAITSQIFNNSICHPPSFEAAKNSVQEDPSWTPQQKMKPWRPHRSTWPTGNPKEWRRRRSRCPWRSWKNKFRPGTQRRTRRSSRRQRRCQLFRPISPFLRSDSPARRCRSA